MQACVIKETSQQSYQVINATIEHVYVWLPAGLMAVRGCTAPAAERLSSACMVELGQNTDVVLFDRKSAPQVNAQAKADNEREKTGHRGFKALIPGYSLFLRFLRLQCGNTIHQRL